MSFYRRTPVRCERPKGVTLAPGARAGENPQEFEPIGSNSWETLRSAQGDMTDGAQVATWVTLIFSNFESDKLGRSALWRPQSLAAIPLLIADHTLPDRAPSTFHKY